jgi:predicted DNA binding protein
VDCCRAADVGFRLRRLFNPESLDVDVTDDLTPEQYEILAAAHERGFFEVPRGVTLGELADRLDSSSNSASQRMRRALDVVVERQLATGRPAPRPTPGDREWTVGSESGS